jgi:hypothetical protein
MYAFLLFIPLDDIQESVYNNFYTTMYKVSTYIERRRGGCVDEPGKYHLDDRFYHMLSGNMLKAFCTTVPKAAAVRYPL